MGIWDDDFTGSDGDPPDSSLWEVVANPDDEFVIDSNTYALSKNTYASPAETWRWITKGLFVSSGDFDFQIDIPSKSFSNSSGSWGYVGLGIEEEGGSVWEMIGAAVYSTFTTRGWVFGSYASGTPEYRIAYSAFSATMSKLRFTRSGTTVKGYYWDTVDSNWQWNNDTDGYTFTGIGAGSVRVLIRGALHGTTASVVQSWTFDNFLVNSGTFTKLAIPVDIDNEIGFQAEIDGYSETAQIPQGIGFQAEIDAESIYNFCNENVGFQAEVDTSGNVLNSPVDGNLGLQGLVDAYVATDNISKTLGLNADVDADFLTKTLSDQVGFNAGVDANREYSLGIDAGLGLQAGVDAFNYSQWLRTQALSAKKIFIVTLTGQADGVEDLELMASSVNARKRNNAKTYVQVVADYSQNAAIVARQNGQIVVETAYIVAGEISLREEIIRADFDIPNTSEGGRNKSITLIGYRDANYGGNAVTLEKSTYRNYSNGLLRHRFASVDPYLNPGDVLTVGDDTYTVGQVSYSISAVQQNMEVSEES